MSAVKRRKLIDGEGSGQYRDLTVTSTLTVSDLSFDTIELPEDGLLLNSSGHGLGVSASSSQLCVSETPVVIANSESITMMEPLLLNNSIVAPLSTDDSLYNRNGTLYWEALPVVSGTVSSAVYTPILSPTINVDALTLYGANYTRVNDIVTVNLTGTVDCTLAATPSQFAVSTPIVGGFGVSTEAHGAINVYGTTSSSGYVDGVVGFSAVHCYFHSVSTGTDIFTVHFSYTL